MSIQTLLDRPTDRRDRRATSHCDIWDMIAPEVPCPACNEEFGDRLERATQDQQDVVVLEDGSGSARDQAADLLGMLAH